MIMRLLFTIACLQTTVFSFAQTEVQKQFMYERINRDSRGSGILPKIEPIPNKETLFSKAQILPVYKVVFDENNSPRLEQNKDYYLVFYIGRLYEFLNNTDSRFFENSTIIEDISKFNLENKKFSVVYFAENFTFDRIYLNPLLSDSNISFIIDRGKTFSLSDYIDYKYGSIHKLKELMQLDILREKLTLEDFNNFIKNSYSAFEYNCPKDTTLVLKTLMNQIKFSTKDFTKGQEVKLTDRIKQKINPFEIIKNQLMIAFKSNKSNDSIIRTNLNELKVKELEFKDAMSNVVGNYEYKIYNVSISNELLEILTNDQFIAYKKYIDLMEPVIETLNTYNNNKYRHGYGKEILIREGIIKPYDTAAFAEYIKQKVKDCGCPFDETIIKR